MVRLDENLRLSVFLLFTCYADNTESVLVSIFADLGRMYQLVSRIQDGLGELKSLLESHIYNQGLAAIEKCGESALNVSIKFQYCRLVDRFVTDVECFILFN